jgi:hypothetical protein
MTPTTDCRLAACGPAELARWDRAAVADALLELPNGRGSLDCAPLSGGGVGESPIDYLCTLRIRWSERLLGENDTALIPQSFEFAFQP